MDPITGVMIGMSAIKFLGAFSDNKSAKKLTKLQRNIMKIQDENVRAQQVFDKEMTAYDYKEISQAYAENYVRLNESYAEEKYKINNALTQMEDKMRMNIKMRGSSAGSIVNDMNNVIHEEKNRALRTSDANLIKQSAEMTKNRTQQYLNAGSNYMGKIKTTSSQLVQNKQLGVNAAINEQKANDNLFNSLIDVGLTMGMTYMSGGFGGAKTASDAGSTGGMRLFGNDVTAANGGNYLTGGELKPSFKSFNIFSPT